MELSTLKIDGVMTIIKINTTRLAQYDTDMTNYNDIVAAHDISASTYANDKLAYEQSQGLAIDEPLSHSSYTVLTGNVKPVLSAKKPDDLKGKQSVRYLYLMTPSINISKKISKDGKNPMRLGVGAKMNIPLGNMISGELNSDLMNRSNQQIFTGKIFLNF